MGGCRRTRELAKEQQGLDFSAKPLSDGGADDCWRGAAPDLGGERCGEGWHHVGDINAEHSHGIDAQQCLPVGLQVESESRALGAEREFKRASELALCLLGPRASRLQCALLKCDRSIGVDVYKRAARLPWAVVFGRYGGRDEQQQYDQGSHNGEALMYMMDIGFRLEDAEKAARA